MTRLSIRLREPIPFGGYARRASRGRKPSVAPLVFLSRSTASTSPASSLRMSKSVIASSAFGGVRPLQVRFHRLRERLRGGFRKQGSVCRARKRSASEPASRVPKSPADAWMAFPQESGSLPVVASQIVFGRRSLRRFVLGLCFACQHGPAFGFQPLSCVEAGRSVLSRSARGCPLTVAGRFPL